jgi:hypothetical protein
VLAARTNGGIMLESSARERHESSYMMLILFSGMLIRDIEMIPLHALTGCGMRVAAESNLAPTCIYFLGTCSTHDATFLHAMAAYMNWVYHQGKRYQNGLTIGKYIS